ncbi:S8/S53 family peptidase [Kribbella pittospori]|uniref:S8/S53 family peptidase n=1 Tax=Kribbella pittospori TaxID=722689 RepID=UPI0013F4814D|nr:S8/S53 family peptidase [Kribbella pittospori]
MVPETPEDAQRALILSGFDRDSEHPRKLATGRGAGTDSGIDFFYEAGTILVREEHFEHVRRILDQLHLLPRGDREPVSRPVIAGIRLIRLNPELNPQLGTLETLKLLREGGEVTINRPADQPGDVDTPAESSGPEQGERPADDAGSAEGAGSEEGERPPNTVPQTVLVTGLGPGVGTPNHLVSITGGRGNGAGCPATEPEPVPAGSAPYPGYTPHRSAGEGVKIVVVDTGFDDTAPDRSDWLKGVEGDKDLGILGNTLEFYAGHGTFIAGVIRSVAPLAEVCVRKGFGPEGTVVESDLVAKLDEIIEKDDPDIISMSAGTYCHDATGLPTFGVFNERRLSHHKGVVFVVAAGNYADRKAFWPAAAPYTVSVGALNTYWHGRASFSDYGGWVDVYAPGQDLINAFPVGNYTYREPPHVGPGRPPRQEEFHGMARWSGTSFSTPLVAGLIAARMSRTGENGRDAAAALIAEARQAAQPGVGAVLLPE